MIYTIPEEDEPISSLELAFNFYVNEKIVYLLETPVNIESAREAFYSELIQNTNLPTNHNFASIITEINKEIEHHTQQRYSITYASKGKRKLQTPAITPKRIQPPTWKKTRVESSTNPSYHYTSGSTINITSTGTATSNTTLTFGQFLFQSKQRKAELLEPYSTYFEGFNFINHLTNTFTTIKQGDTEAITTYLRCFHRNLHQIQAIQADYFTVPQILNQFIRRLCSSIFQQIRSMHPVDLLTTITHARDFEAAELEANHAQAVNLVMNKSSDLDSKLKQFSNTINQKLEGYLADNYAIYQPPQ
ncbi:hypothetical protein G9A89_022616 [Geosiphon pyriformis]|nr:hypothetical protein G9A89_022616 [Geosiphon pyriformis]